MACKCPKRMRALLRFLGFSIHKSVWSNTAYAGTILESVHDGEVYDHHFKVLVKVIIATIQKEMLRWKRLLLEPWLF